MQGSATNCGAHQSSVSERSHKAAKTVDRGQRQRHDCQRRHMGLQLIEQLLVQVLLARQRPLLGAQRLVFKGLEFGRDEALGVLERLAAPVVGRHLVGLALRDLDVKAMHLVELHAQIA